MYTSKHFDCTVFSKDSIIARMPFNYVNVNFFYKVMKASKLLSEAGAAAEMILGT